MARAGLRSHLAGSVPISIAAHLVVLILLLIIPLAADMALPPPERGLPEFVRAEAPPPPPFVPAAPRPSGLVSPASDVAPVTAPTTIQPEVPRTAPQFDVPMGPPGGLPAGIGEIGSLTPPVGAPPPEPPHVPSTVRVAQLPQAPRKLVDARPMYPDIARAAHVEGTVVLEAVLDTYGNVTELRVVRSVPLLDQAALDAVRQWKYTPSVYAGRPVSVLMTITIRFTLHP